jgi:hypothetical protein
LHFSLRQRRAGSRSAIPIAAILEHLGEEFVEKAPTNASSSSRVCGIIRRR